MPTVLDIVASLRDIPETARDTLAAALVAGTGVSITVNDGANTLTITATPAAGSIALSNMANLAANSIIGNNTGAPATPLALTATQVKALLALASADVSDFAETVRDTMAAALVAGSNVTITPNDGADTITVAASAAGLVLLDTQTVSGAASVSLATGIGSSYDAYRIVGVLKFSAAGQLRLRTSTNGGSSFDSGGSDYSYANKFTSSAPTSADGGSGAGTAFIPLTTTGAVGNSSTDSVSFDIVLFKPSDAALYTHMVWHTQCNTGTTGYLAIGSGMRSAAADVDALQLYPDTGTVTGAVRVYGMRNS